MFWTDRGGGLKKSKKTRLTIGLLRNSDDTYKGHPVVIGKFKSPKCFKTHARLLSATAAGKKFMVEYYDSTNACMTTKIFTEYIKKLDRSFRREDRKIALLLDNSEDHTQNTKGNYSCRRFQLRLGNILTTSNNIGILDERRNSTFNKRQRVEDDSFCFTTPCKIFRKLNDKDILGQYHGTQVHDKIERNVIVSSTRSGNSNTRIMQPIQPPTDISTYSRDREYKSGSIKSIKEITSRSSNSESIIQQDPTTMGTFTTGCICSEAQHPTTDILGTNSGSRSNCDRCVPTILENKGDLSISSMEINTKVIEEDQGATVDKSGIGDTPMAESILVSHNIEDETHPSTNSMESKRKWFLSRMVTIDDYRQKAGIEQSTRKFLHNKARQSTQKNYDNG